MDRECKENQIIKIELGDVTVTININYHPGGDGKALNTCTGISGKSHTYLYNRILYLHSTWKEGWSSINSFLQKSRGTDYVVFVLMWYFIKKKLVMCEPQVFGLSFFKILGFKPVG